MLKKAIAVAAALLTSGLLLVSESEASTVSGYGYLGIDDTWPVYLESDAQTVGTSSTRFTNWSYLLLSIPGYDISGVYDSLTVSVANGTKTAIGTGEGYTSDFAVYTNIAYTFKQAASGSSLTIAVSNAATGATLYKGTLDVFEGSMIVSQASAKK